MQIGSGKISGNLKLSLLINLSFLQLLSCVYAEVGTARLTLEAPITTAADDIHKYFSLFF